MALSIDDYLAQLQALLPKGPAWPRDKNTLITKLLTTFSEEFSSVDARIESLINEADPRTTVELLADWERVCGLPDGCTGPLTTLSERRDAVVSRLTTEGGQSAAYYIAVAATIGYTITVTEEEVHTCMSGCDDPINSEEWRFVWNVIAAEANSVRFFNVNDGVDSALASWGNALLECTINRLKPAHTLVRFIYP